MFLKNFRIKSNTAIRGSDRRKLRADVLREFSYITQECVLDIIPNKEDMSVMKIMTHSGQNVTAYFLNGSPIFFQVEAKLYPTVYLLWKYPDMLPSFTTWPNVFEKIHGGADLMLPGVILPDSSLENLMEYQKGDVCSVALLGNRAPIAVGYTTVSSCEAKEQGMRGKGVIILHSYLDQLWCEGSKIDVPIIEPTSSVDMEKACDTSEMPNNIVEELTSKKNTTVKNVEEDSVSDIVRVNEEESESLKTLNNKMDKINLIVDVPDLKEELECSDDLCVLSSQEVDKEDISSKQTSSGLSIDLTTDNINSDILENKTMGCPADVMDELLEGCFLHTLLNTKDNDLPILTSTFYKNYLLPCCPRGQTLDIKKSSYKKLTKFLQVMENRGFISLKELSKGVHSIDSINWSHEDLRSFKKENCNLLQEKPHIDQEVTVDTKFQPPEIEEVLAVSGSTQLLFKGFGYNKGDILSAKDVRQLVTNYVKSQELVSSENKRMALLDPVLFSVVHKKGEENIDCLPWDELFRRIIDRMNPCHKVTFGGQPPIIRKGKLESIEVKVVQRMGNKKVTLVHNLEYYGIGPSEFAHKMQLKAASSTSVSQLPGKSNPGQQILIQGNQIQHVATMLQGDYQIAAKYINGLDKLKQSGRKKK